MGHIRAKYAGIGIEASSGFSFTLQRGISPSTVNVTMKANTELADIPKYGSLLVTSGDVVIDPEICMWVDGDIEKKTSRSGDLITFTLKDRRWRWKYGFYTARYNQPDKEGIPDPDPTTKKNALEIFTELRAALGGSYRTSADNTFLSGIDSYEQVWGENDDTFDISNVPNDIYPAVDWEMINPAQAMQELCDELGLCIILQWDGRAKVYELGNGAAMPAGKYDEASTTTPTPELPEALAIIGARIVKEKTFTNESKPTEWEAVGMETEDNGSAIVAIDDLLYKPACGWAKALRGGFRMISDEEARKLAKKCIYKWYRWNPADTSTRENFLPWLNMRSERSEVKASYERAEPLLRVAYMDRIKNSSQAIHQELNEVTDGWTLDAKKGIIKFNEPKFIDTSVSEGDKCYGYDFDSIDLPTISLKISYESRTNEEEDFYIRYLPSTYDPDGADPDIITWPGGAQATCGLHFEKSNELVAYWVDDGTPDGTYQNKTELDAYADALLLKTEVQYGRDRPPSRIPTYKTFLYTYRKNRIANKNKALSDDRERAVSETRGGASQMKARGDVVEPPETGKGMVLIKNTHGTSAPAGSFAERVDVEASTGVIEVTRPTEDNVENVVILRDAIEADGYGIAYEAGSSYVAHTGDTPAVGGKVGSVKDQWTGEESATGTHVVGALDADSNVIGFYGGVGGQVHFCQIVDEAGTQVLKKVDPTDPESTEDFDVGMDEVYEGITGDTLDSLAISYPDDTFLIIYEDSSGTYFVHPFTQMRPFQE